MKQYENEVLSFDTSSKKGYAAMQKTLSEWGASGFAIVSVVGGDLHANNVIVFLQREVNADTIGGGGGAAA